MKIENDKYYTEPDLAQYVINKAKEIIGEQNITEWLEPSAGKGVFLDYLPEGTLAYDIEPEDPRIIKQDYLTLDLPYKKGRCVVGNPPFGGGAKSNLQRRFLEKSSELGDYVVFILSIKQHQNTYDFQDFDLIYSEDLGVREFSGKDIRCCLNIYKRPEYKKPKKKANHLKCLMIKVHHRHKEGSRFANRNKTYLGNCDYRICGMGGSIGRKVTIPNTYCLELCLFVDEKFRERVIKLLETTDYKKEFPTISFYTIPVWRMIEYIKRHIPDIE